MDRPDTKNNKNLSDIAHKLRTPLTVITSTVNNFIDGAFGPLSDGQTKWIKKLGNHTETLQLLMDELLDQLRDRNPPTLGAKDIHKKKKAEKSKTMSLNDDTPPTILIVDDEPDILETIEEGLGMIGFETLTASNGEDAMKLALNHKPDVILMDVLLKTQNGMDICRDIKTALPSFVPVLLVTGQNDLQNKISETADSPDDVLMKPFHMEELFSRVRSMLRIKKLNDELSKLKTELNKSSGEEAA